MNILWLKPDGGVAVTHLTPKAAALMQWAADNRAKLDDKIPLAAERSAAESALAAGQTQIDRVGLTQTETAAKIQTLEPAARAAMAQVALAVDADKLTADQARGELEAIAAKVTAERESLGAELESQAATIAELEALQKTRREDLAAIDERIAEIERIEEVRDTIGLDHDGHEAILKRRAQAEFDAAAAVGKPIARPEILDQVCVAHDVTLPADRTYRRALVYAGGALVHDLAKAREIHKNLVRAQRKPLLEALDIEQLRAQARGDTAAVVAVDAKKQALRDAPADPAIAAASTIDELKAAIPAALKADQK